MRKIKEILRLKWDAGLGVQQIARSCGVSHSTVGDILKRAEAAKLPWPLPENLDEASLESLLYPIADAKSASRPLPDMNYIHRELRRKGVTLQLLWQEYKLDHPDGLQYSQFCERYRQWRSKLDLSMRQVHKAGEKMFVDWAGETVPVMERDLGEVRQAYIFVAVLGASSYAYVEATFSQDLENWIAAHCC